jgi:hypothetical protein
MTSGLHFDLLVSAFARLFFLLFLFVLSYVAVFLWTLRFLEHLIFCLPSAIRCARLLRAAWHVPAQISYRITLLLVAAACWHGLLFETNTVSWPAPESGPIALWAGAILGGIGAACGFTFVSPIRRKHQQSAQQTVREIIVRRTRLSIW